MLTSPFKSKPFDVRSWTFGNLGYCFPYHCGEGVFLDSLIQRSSAPKAEKDIESSVLHRAYARDEHVHFFYLYMTILIDRPVPTFYDVSYKVLVSLISSIFVAYSDIILFQSFELPLLIGSIKKFVAFYIIHYQIAHSIVFRSTSFPGWLVQHWK